MDRLQAIIAHWNWLAEQTDQYLAERRAECALLGHDSSGEVFLTLNPTHVCIHCMMRYCIGEGFGYVEGR